MNKRGIVVKDAGKTYIAADNINVALQNINLTIKPGEYIGLMGMNGAGKSTLVRLLNGLIIPSEGTVYVDGLDTACADNIFNVRQLVGIVFQNPDNQLICPVVEEEIAFGPENIGLSISEVNARIDWALQILGLAEMKHHSPHLLSGGQKQKVALASILAMMPSYLVLDEPFSMLDPKSRRELLEQLRILNIQQNMTIILSSHNPEDFIHASRLIVIEQGSIYLQGTPEEVFSQEDELAAIGLEPPTIYKIIKQLQENDCHIADNIKAIQELVDIICQR